MFSMHRTLFPVSPSSNCRKVGIRGYDINREGINLFIWWEEQTHFPTSMWFKQDRLKRFQPVTATNRIGPLLDVKQHECHAISRRIWISSL